MNFDIALLLTQDGITNGAIYAMIAVGVVLVFNVTRVVFVGFGDLIAYAALTLATIQAGRIPGTIWLVLGLAVLALLIEAVSLWRRRRLERLPRAVAIFGLAPLAAVACGYWFGQADLPQWAQMVLAVIVVVPLGPLLYRVVFQPMASASVLALLMAAVAMHFAMAGIALILFGAEGFRTTQYVSGFIPIGVLTVPKISLVVISTAAIMVVLLYLFFEHARVGKMLRATAINPIGARLVGIRTTRAGSLAFLLATLMAAVSGVLIGPMITVYFDTGFLVGLKGFVGAVVGGFVSYPLALVGAVMVGLIESFSSFHSSAYKDVIVFAALVPIVIIRWLLTGSHQDDDGDDDL